MSEVPSSGERMGAGARVLREIIRTPAFLEIIKANMAEAEPERARALVRTFLWEDADLSLSLMGTAPRAMNYLVEAVLELGRQLATFPPPLLEAFSAQLGEELDSAAVREIPAVYGPVLEKLMSESPETREKLVAGLYSGVNGAIRASVSAMELIELEGAAPPGAQSLDTEALGRLVTQSARLVSRSVERNPYLLRDVLENVDVREVGRAGLSIMKSVAICLFSLAGRLASRLAGYFS